MSNGRGMVRGIDGFVLDGGTQSQTEGLFQELISFNSKSMSGYMTNSTV